MGKTRPILVLAIKGYLAIMQHMVAEGWGPDHLVVVNELQTSSSV